MDIVCIGQRKLCGHCVCWTEEVVWTLCVLDRGSCVTMSTSSPDDLQSSNGMRMCVCLCVCMCV